jgi:hypothetical protein
MISPNALFNQTATYDSGAPRSALDPACSDRIDSSDPDSRTVR